jgi:putative transposase
MDNAMIESFNGTFRDESLDANWFLSTKAARKKIEKWREEYNFSYRVIIRGQDKISDVLLGDIKKSPGKSICQE